MSNRLKILLVEPFFGGSHKKWAEGYKRHSGHQVEILSLPDRHWKWRMHGAAITLSERFRESDFAPDLVLATDILDVATFAANCRSKLGSIPIATYFHENQIAYPWSANDMDRQLQRDNHYGFINYTSALISNKVIFNSNYHMHSFLESLPEFLKQFPDHQNLNTVRSIEEKCSVVHLGLDLKRLDELKPRSLELRKRAVILWNHRWEYDKNPEAFFNSLYEIQNRGWDFNLVVLGERFNKYPSVFDEAKERLSEKIIHWGFADDESEYVRWLWESDILPVTSNQDFFGGSIVEAMYCNVKPLLPKRLAYPEHLPDRLHPTFFYNEGELTTRLQNWIKDVAVIRKQQTRTFVERYDWSEISSKMDRVLADLIE